MKRIAIIMAMAQEINVVAERLTETGFTEMRRNTFRSETLEVRFFRCGVGCSKINILTKNESYLRSCNSVLVTGLAGAVNKTFSVGQAVVPQNIILLNDTKKALDNQVAIFEQIKHICPAIGNTVMCETLATADHLVTHTEKRMLHGIDAVDMESYTVLEWMEERSIPAFCFRIVSDAYRQKIPTEQLLISFMQPANRRNVWRIMRHPINYYRTIKLLKTSNRALRRLSECVMRWLRFVEADFDVSDLLRLPDTMS